MSLLDLLSNEVHHGDCVARLKEWPDNHFSACVTDAPYEIGFMGRGHDKTGVSFRPETWAEVLRVLRPGAHLLAFGGTRTYHRIACAIEDGGFECRDVVQWLYSQGMPKSKNLHGEHEGWGTALKPAGELVCLARKPLSEDTVEANVLKWGTGAINIDASRVVSEGGGCSRDGEATAERRYTEKGSTNFAMKPGPRGGDAKGRWPANIITDGSDDVRAAFPDAAGQLAKSVNDGSESGNVIYGKLKNQGPVHIPRVESDKNASRFFYVAKPTRAERDFGLKDSGGNTHTTVKPIALMEHLVRLVTPRGGALVDPFVGSGSTIIAAERLGYSWTAIELEKDHAELAKKRIAAWRGKV